MWSKEHIYVGTTVIITITRQTTKKISEQRAKNLGTHVSTHVANRTQETIWHNNLPKTINTYDTFIDYRRSLLLDAFLSHTALNTLLNLYTQNYKILSNTLTLVVIIVAIAIVRIIRSKSCRRLHY